MYLDRGNRCYVIATALTQRRQACWDISLKKTVAFGNELNEGLTAKEKVCMHYYGLNIFNPYKLIFFIILSSFLYLLEIRQKTSLAESPSKGTTGYFTLSRLALALLGWAGWWVRHPEARRHGPKSHLGPNAGGFHSVCPNSTHSHQPMKLDEQICTYSRGNEFQLIYKAE